jgi:hypothetical protein
MGFNSKEFKKVKFVPRSEDISVPILASWFEGPAIWKVRGLEGNELGRCNDLADRNRRAITSIAEGLVSDKSAETVDAIKALVGLSDNVPDENAKRIEYLQAGSVDPICDLELAVRINAYFPVQFREITNKILQLTGFGYEVGK